MTSYERSRDRAGSVAGDLDLHARIGTLAEEQRRHLDTALQALEALKFGNIGLLGAELRLSTGMTRPPKR